MYVLVVMWMLGGFNPLIKEYEFPDSQSCNIALGNAFIKEAPQGDSHLIVFCQPKKGN